MTLLIIGLLVYFIPCFVAAYRNHPNGAPIAVVNLFLGWTLIGWVVALAWSVKAFDERVGGAAR